MVRKKSVARPRKWGFYSFCDSKIEMKSQRATENAAERKRSRNEAGTGQCFGPNCCRSRANSAIPKGIAVLGRSDALAARGGRAEDEPDNLGE